MLKASNSLPQLATVAKKEEDTALHYSGINNVQVQNLLWKGLAGEMGGLFEIQQLYSQYVSDLSVASLKL